MQVIKVKGAIPWSVKETVEGPWVAVCDSLGLTVQSDTWADLMDDIGSTLELMFADLLEEGQLDQFFQQRGWTRQTQYEVEPEATSENFRFDIPFIPTLASHDVESQMLPA